MKKEELGDAFGKIDDDIISSAEKYRSSKKKRRFNISRWVAVAACICLVAGCIYAGVSRRTDNFSGNGENTTTKKPVSAFALAEAYYPEMAKYPDEDSFIEADGTMDSDGFSDAYTAWYEDRKTQLNQYEGYKDGMTSFFMETVRNFLDEDKDNVVYSPINLYIALSMLAETTDGNSRQQILDLLGVEDINELRSKVYALWNANYCDDGAITSILGNSLWLNKNRVFKQDTLDILATKYYASSFWGEMGSEEFNEQLRSWINEQTKNLLADSVKNLEMREDTLMALVSTIYFSAKWQQKFDDGNTKKDTFHGANGDVECDFMNAKEFMGSYISENKFAAISLEFSEGGSMKLILPNDGVEVSDLIKDEEVMNNLFSGNFMKNSNLNIINLSMPKFDVGSDLDLIEKLQDLGVTDVFDAYKSDFTPITDEDNLYVSEVQHSARVKIDEEGCTAAAFTVIMMAEGAPMPEETVDFILDRPFMFIITGNDGSPLFTGVVNNPS